MKLLLVRHAAAMPRGTAGVSDDERPLTPSGSTKFRVAARGLAQITRRPDVLLTSPFARARVSAIMIPSTLSSASAGSSWGAMCLKARAAISAESHPLGATVALVGHEPLLSALLARLLGATEGERLTLEKGGAALVNLPGGPAAPGRLIWFLPPRVLRIVGANPDFLGGRESP
jgi:phosphohistidine phosphatase